MQVMRRKKSRFGKFFLWFQIKSFPFLSVSDCNRVLYVSRLNEKFSRTMCRSL